MNSFMDALVLFSFFYLWFGVICLVIWGVILFLFLELMDSYFDSPDFPNRGYKGVWPWGMGRAMAYGVFLLFTNSKFVRRKFPHARETINIKSLPREIKVMVAFPMYTYIPTMIFMFLVWVVTKINGWFF